jgi:hypothetical protein
LSPEQCEELLRALKARFEKNMDRLENFIHRSLIAKSLGFAFRVKAAKQCESFLFQRVNNH